MGLFSLFKGNGMVYFPGDLTYFKFREFYELYLKIFSKLGIKVSFLDKQNSSGLFALQTGYETGLSSFLSESFIKKSIYSLVYYFII